MELEIIRKLENKSSDARSLAYSSYNFIENNKGIAVPYLTFISVITFIGTVGNALVLGTLLTVKNLRTIGNLFVANLAVADLCVTSFINPFAVVGIVYGKRWFEDNVALCKVIGFICTVSCLVSMLTIVMISINRYIHICHHSGIYLRVYTRTNTLLMCFSLWFITSLLQIPAFFGLADYEFDSKSHSCLWDRLHYNLYMAFTMGSTEVITGIAVFYCYLKIFLFVRETRNKVSSSRTAQRERDESLKLARTIAIIFLVYFFCWAPYTAISLGDRQDNLPLVVHLWAITMAHANSSFNSIVYATTNKQFRDGYLRLLMIDQCLTKCHSDSEEEIVSPYYIKDRTDRNSEESQQSKESNLSAKNGTN